MVHSAAAVREPYFFVKRDRPWVSLPHAKPEMCAAKGSGDAVNCTHQLMSDTLAVRRAIDVKAVQLDRSRCGDTGRRIFALHLGEGYQYFALVREQRNHVWVDQFLSLLKVAESAAQVRSQIVGSVVRAEGLFKGPRSKGGQCRGVALEAGTNQNGFLVGHGSIGVDSTAPMQDEQKGCREPIKLTLTASQELRLLCIGQGRIVLPVRSVSVSGALT